MENDPFDDDEYTEQIVVPNEEWGNFTFRHDNTFIVLYDDDEYEDKQHITYIREDGRPLFIYDCENLMELLFDNGWEAVVVRGEPHASVYVQLGDIATRKAEIKPRDFTELPAASNQDLWELFNIKPEDFKSD